MKVTLSISILLLALFCLQGCATMSEAEFTSWTAANKEIAKTNADAFKQPTFDLTLTPDGKVQGIRVYAQPVVQPYIAQKEPNPWIKTVDRAIGMAGWIGGAIVVKDMMNDIGKNAGHNTTGSYNTDRHDSGDYRDIGSLNQDHSNRSINDSYNDRHDIADSYNDRHDINNSYNPDSHNTSPVAPQ